MTRKQRQKSRYLSDVRASLGAFVDKPCRLTVQQTESLLGELCVKLGYCLAPADFAAVVADPPTDPQAFAELVMKLEGVDVADRERFMAVLERVLKTFEGVARAEGRDLSQL
jgi:hypothetical protein